MRCRKCLRENGLLIRAMCKACAPELHLEHESQMNAVGILDRMFQEETGKTALQDWYGFENFVEQQRGR